MRQMKQRSEIPMKEQWNLSNLFESRELSSKALEEVSTSVQSFEETYRGRLANPTTIVEAISAYEEIVAASSKVGQYASLPVSVDITDSEAVAYSRETQQKLAALQAKLSFFESELLERSIVELDKLVELEPSLAPYVRRLKRQKKAALHPAVEETLQTLQPILNVPSQLFEQARSRDMKFPSFDVDGFTYPLSIVLYEDHYATHPDQRVRRESFRLLSETFGEHQHVIAQAYYTQVQKEKTMATLRGYDSVFDYLLEGQEVDATLYHRQIDVLMEKFAPVMRKFMAIVKEDQQLDELFYADLKLGIDPEGEPLLTMEEAERLVQEGVAPLGVEYQALMQRAFDERWIDSAQNIGKRSGAFCSTTYRNNPYILISWGNTLTDLYTLFHELGHAGQGVLSHQSNRLLAARPSLYLIEAPSTFHELLLTDLLLEQASDLRSKRAILAKMIAKTYYHNFVTHLIEAAFQREVYGLIDEGKSFDAEKLNDLMHGVLQKFWGDTVLLEPGSERTWMRQIHYYMGLYPYTYSAGLTIATSAHKRYKEDEKTNWTDWLTFLQMGGTLPPIEAAQSIGISIDTETPLLDTIAFLEETVDEIASLTKELQEVRDA